MYQIKHRKTGKAYIGMKYFRTKSNPWPAYCGSNEELKADIEKYGKDAFDFTIIELCRNRATTRASEMRWHLFLGVLSNKYYNKCIGHMKWFNAGTYPGV